MLIRCPKCNTIYDIADNLLAGDGKKLRCANCGNVWLAKSDDAIPSIAIENMELSDNGLQQSNVENDETLSRQETEPLPPTTDKDVTDPEPKEDGQTDPGEDALSAEEIEDLSSKEEIIIEKQEDKNEINEIFSRLASQTESIFNAENGLSKSDKAAAKAAKALGTSSSAARSMIYIVLFLLVFLSLFYARYEIVRLYPPFNKIYSAMGIKASIPGYGLEFQNISRNEFEEDYIHKMEIKGFIINSSKHMVDIPTISVQLMDQDTNIIQTVESHVPLRQLAPDGRIPFTIIVVKPSPLTRYVLLTFTE